VGEIPSRHGKDEEFSLTTADTFQPPNRIGEMLVSSRSLAEYRAMFALTDDHLSGTVLDCPGGAASFAAEANAAGGRVTACDPLYELPLARIREIATGDLRRAYRYHSEHPDEYVWRFFSDAEHYLASRSRSIDLFAAHHERAPRSYVAASLPALPFADGAFDLALCSHLLFSYADRLDRRFHLSSILELARVAGEVRVFPLVPMGMTENPDLPAIRSALSDAGLTTTVSSVDYEFQRGGDELMTVVRTTG
jgi:SAM-dependent methyltransferase